MNVILIVIQIVASVALVGLILMQQGKGADAGASFGAGASQTFFGSAGSANAVTKLTALFAAIFFAASLALAYVAQEQDRTGLQKELSEQLAPALPAAGDAVNSGLAPQKSEPALNDDLVPVEESSDKPLSEDTLPEEDTVPEEDTLPEEDVAPN